MPSATATKTISLKPRGVEAVWRALETLEVSDPKLLASVMVEAAGDELEHNSRFASKVRMLYDALGATKKQPRRPAGGPKLLPPHIKPIRHVEGREFDIGAPPDPFFLFQVFGASQLAEVLRLYSVAALQQGVEIVQDRKPGAKPKGKTKAALVGYLMQQVVGAA